MAFSNEQLDRIESWAKIISALGIPLVLAIGGVLVQRALTADGLKKDYVGIAVGILKESPKDQDSDLRSWAVQMLDSNSPIPFSTQAKDSLRSAPLSPPSAASSPPLSVDERRKRAAIAAALSIISN